MNQIPLAKLTPSPTNVRVAKTSKYDDKSLAASIKTHGVLQNLIVKANDDDTYEVIAGGRRLAALNALVDEGELQPDALVPCTVKDGDLTEISLVENRMRAQMHPADAFVAFAKRINHFILLGVVISEG